MKKLALFLILFLSAASSVAQESGVPTFGAAEVHEIDTINLYSLTPVLNIPIYAKAGAIPLGMTLTSPQTCREISVAQDYNAFTCSAVQNVPDQIATFSPTPNELMGSVVSFYGPIVNACSGGRSWILLGITGPDGLTFHPTSPTTVYENCAPTSVTITTIDSSGYTVYFHPSASNGQVFSTITAVDGESVTETWTPNGFSSSGLVDPFGNKISPSNGGYTDTLGISTLTVSGGSGSKTFTWPDTNGNSQTTTLNLGTTSYTFSPFCVPGTVNVPPGGTVTPFASVSYPDSSSIGFTWATGKNGAGTASGLLKSFTLRTGGTVTYSGPCIDGTGATGSLTRTTADGTTTYTVQNTNSCGIVCSSSTTTVVDPGGNKTLYYFTESWTSGALPVYTTVLTETQKYNNTGTVANPIYTLVSTDVVCYNGNTANCPTASVNFPVTSKVVTHTIAGMSTSSQIATAYDSYGNVLTVKSYDFGASTPTFTTTNTYGSWNGSACAAIGNGIVNHVCESTEVDANGNATSDARSTYNSTGAITASVEWTGAAWLTTSYSPNSNGTVASVTDPNGLVTNYGYGGSGGCNNLLPTSMTANGLTEFLTWNCNGAVVMTETDANNNQWSKTYDGLFRTTSITDPLNFAANIAYPSANETSVTTSFGSVATEDNVFVDGFGSEIRVNSLDLNSRFATVSTSYMWSGTSFQIKQSTPCFTSSETADCPTTVTHTMDGTGRLVSSVDGNGGTGTAAYVQNDALATLSPPPSGEHNKQVQKEVDGIGRMKSVCKLQTSGGTNCGQASGGSGILMTYAYSTMPGQTTVNKSSGSQTHTTVSDAIGRATSVTAPESGTETNTYDSSSSTCGSYASKGDLVETARPGGIHVCYQYDVLHRVVQITNSFDSTCRLFAYDTANNPPNGVTIKNAKARLVEAYTVTSNCASKTNLQTDDWFSYDADGRTTDVWESTPNSGGYYHTSVAYNPNGTVSSLSGIPSFPSITQALDAIGRPISASLGSTPLVSNVTFDAFGHPLVVTSNSNNSDAFTYDPNTGNMKTYSYNVNGTTDNGSLTWNANGTLQSLQITDNLPGSKDSETCSFVYDDVARLTTDSCGSTWSQTYSYDQYDNLTKSGSIAWNPGYSSTNNHYTGFGATYDGNGQITYDGTNTYTWTPYGKIASTLAGNSQAACGTSGTCLTYDALGRVAEINVSGVLTEFMYSPLGKTGLMSGQSVTKAYFELPGENLLDTETGGTTNNVYHRDWVGTARLVATVNGGVISTQAYSPYGDIYARNGRTSPKFAGDDSEIFSGLFDTPNRQLMVPAARWLSPDPARDGWNSYAYPTDPNSDTDPTGLWNYADTMGEDGCGANAVDCNPQTPAPAPAAKCSWLAALFGCGNKSPQKTPGPTNGGPDFFDSAKDLVAGRWGLNSVNNSWNSFKATANTKLQNAKQDVDWYNKWLGFAPSDCSKGGDCLNAAGMAATSLFVMIDSFGESEEANGAKALKQLKEAPAVVDFLRNELLAQAKDPALRDAIENLFRSNAKVGDGSSMGMLREEIQTGAERRHWQKLIDRRTQLLRIYRSGRLSGSDRAITRGLLIAIQDALSTRPPI